MSFSNGQCSSYLSGWWQQVWVGGSSGLAKESKDVGGMKEPCLVEHAKNVYFGTRIESSTICRFEPQN
jgi:hypothetical protein